MGTPKWTVLRAQPSGPDVGRRSDPPPWATLAWVLPAFAALLARMRAIDLAYHVRTGELTLRTGEVVVLDPFTFTASGQRWLNQQWAAQSIFAIAHRLLGWAGVGITYAAALGSGFALLYRSCRRARAIPRTAALLTLLGFLVASGSLAARPQALAVPLFTGTWLLLARRDRWSFIVPILAVVWANVHGSFVLAPLLAAFALVDDLLERRPVGHAFLLLLVTAGATVITPFGPRVWSYALDIAGNETIRNSVAEWRPPSPLSVSGAPFWLSGIAVAITGMRKRRVVRPMDVAILLVFFALGAPALRGTLWWALIAPPVVAGWFRVPGHAISEPQQARGGVPAALPIAILLTLLPIALVLRAGTDPVTGAPERLAADAPERLVEAARQALPAGSRLLVFQPFASWFEYALPGRPVMVDSRIELFPATVWRDYALATRAGEGWEETLERYRIDGVVLPPGEVLGEALARAEDWDRTHLGPTGSVFIRS